MFGTILNSLLKEKNISQAELANKIGYSQRSISNWVNNRTLPTASAVRNCALFFEVSADYLIELKDDNGTKIQND